MNTKRVILFLFCLIICFSLSCKNLLEVASEPQIQDNPEILKTVKTPQIVPNGGIYYNPTSANINCATIDASIRYTTDGSTPTATYGTLYTGALIAINNTQTIKAVAYIEGTNEISDIRTIEFKITGTVANPTLTIGGGNYNTEQTETITCSDPAGASIRYTTDGSTPSTTHGTLYTGPFQINQTCTLKAIAYKTDWGQSSVISATYTFKVDDPVITPASGTYGSVQTISIVSQTPGHSIRYTTDGSDPTPTTGTLYSGTFELNANANLKAIAYRDGWTSSSIITREYKVDILPPVPGNSGTITTSDVKAGSIKINWTKGTDDSTNDFDLQYRVYYSTSDNIDTVANIEINGTPANDYTVNINSINISLAQNTTYYFNVIVRDDYNRKSCYNMKQEKTLVDVTPPTPGDGGNIDTYATLTSVDLSWVAATDDSYSANTLSYIVYYSLANNLTSVDSIESFGTPYGGYTTNITNKTITGLNSGTIYYFNVIVKDGLGNKACYTMVQQATNNDTTAPTPGSGGNITASSVAGNSLTLSWTKGSDDVTPQADLQYRVYRSISNNISTVATIELNGTFLNSYTTNISSFNVTSLNDSTTYYFNVIIRDAAGNKSCYVTRSATTLDLTAPIAGGSGTITTSGITSTSLTLSWTKGTDNITPQADLQYRVYRSISNNISTVATIELNGTFLNSYTTNISSFNVTSLNPSTTYYFNVIIRDAAGNKSCYVTRSATTLVGQYTVTYNGNGHTHGDLPESQIQNAGTIITVQPHITPSGRGVAKVPYPGTGEAYKFGGWNTQANGSGTTYTAGTGTFTLTGNITLYAKWVKFDIGDMGPAQGYVFYDKGTYTNGWRYLESSGGPGAESYWISTALRETLIGTSTAVGTGYDNTKAICEHPLMSTSTWIYSSFWNVTCVMNMYVNAQVYGPNHWIVASRDELTLIRNNLILPGILPVSNPGNPIYYSSSEASATTIWIIDLSTGVTSTRSKGNVTYVNFPYRVRRF